MLEGRFNKELKAKATNNIIYLEEKKAVAKNRLISLCPEKSVVVL